VFEGPVIPGSKDPVIVASGQPEPLVALRGISKRYGDLLANDGVDLEVAPGEIHALLGENGAGKSTLVKILYGAIQPSAGEILWQGRAVSITSPVEARRLGIGMVFQHFSLFEALTVGENVAVALPDLSLRDVRARLSQVGETYGLALDPRRPVWSLSAGERQRIEIIRCLLQNPKLLVLDEPTSVLTPQEADRLFDTLERLASEGRAILYISHRLEEVRRLSRRATILRQGRVVATADPRAMSAGDIAALMVGSEVGRVEAHEPHAQRAEMLRVDHLSLPPQGLHGQPLRDLSLTAWRGEILGIAGVAGNGQGELFEALSGERLASRPDAIRIEREPVGHLGVEARRARSAAFVPEERLGHAAVPSHALTDNALLTHHGEGATVRAGLVAPGAIRTLADAITRQFDVRVPHRDPEARRLSGGNLQKFVIGREIIRQPRLLVVNQPTWGVDAGAARLIRQALVDLAEAGSAVVLISQDLDELFEIADQIAVLHDGRLGPARPTGEWTREAIGLEMLGVGAGEGGQHAA
jgi:simple sugar transport system ATP-binding protein